MTQGTDYEAMNRLVLIHWEPEAYERLPPERDTQLLLELVTAALTYREVLIKDTDLILNDRVIRTLQGSPQSFDLFAQLIGLGLIKILLRPLDQDYAASGLDPAVSPIMIRARDIPFKERPWVPEEHHRRFYAAVDALLCKYPHGMVPVTKFQGKDRNPFAQWLGDLLPQWQEIVQISEFRDIDPEIASVLTRFCHEEGAWFKFLKEKNPKAIGPGDEDRPLSRSPIYRCLAAFEGEHKGFKNLVQSVYNACYCHAERAAGTFLDGYLVEPPHLLTPEEKRLATERFQGLTLFPAASTNIPITPGIAEVLLETRESRSGTFERLQWLLTKMKKDAATKAEARKALTEVAQEFGRNAERLQRGGDDSQMWNIGWSVIVGAAGLAAAVGFKPTLMGVTSAISGLMILAPLMLEEYRSHARQSDITQNVVDACHFRGSHLIVPKHIDWLEPNQNPQLGI